LSFGWKVKKIPGLSRREFIDKNGERDVPKSMKSISALLFVLAASSSATVKDKDPGARSEFVTSWDGARIHYIEASRLKMLRSSTKGNISASGPQETFSILFVPGFTMPAWIWENQIAHFSVDHRVVAMDLRSQGKSSKTGGYSGACRSHIPRSNRSSVPRQTDHAFRGMPISRSEVKPIRKLRLSE
jgi:hypothetical protein